MNRDNPSENSSPSSTRRDGSSAAPRAANATTGDGCCIRSYICTYSTAGANSICRNARCGKIFSPGAGTRPSAATSTTGETPDEALRREVREELGVTEFTPERLTQYIFDSVRERELVYVNRTVYDGPVTPSDETDGGRFWTIGQILRTLGTGLFTPNFESEFRRVFPNGRRDRLNRRSSPR